MSEDRLAEIEARLGKATQGPWRVGGVKMSCLIQHNGQRYGGHGSGACVYTFNGWYEPESNNDAFVHDIYRDDQPIGSLTEPTMIAGNYDYESGGIVRYEDANFIAHSRDDVGWLIKEVKRLRELRQQDQHIITTQAAALRRAAYCPNCTPVGDQRTSAESSQQRPTD